MLLKRMCALQRIAQSPALLSIGLLLGSHVTAKAAETEIPDTTHTAQKLVADIHGTFTTSPRSVPSAGVPGGPLAGNGDLGLVVGGPPEQLRFYVGKADFFGVVRGGIMPVGSLALSIPELTGSSYLMQQNIGPANVTGKFTNADGSELSLTSWVAATKNVIVVQLANTGNKPLTVSSQLLDGWSTSGNAATYGSSMGTTWLRVSPDTLEVNVGNRLHGGTPGAFQGQIADVKIFDRALASDTETKPLYQWQPASDTPIIGKVTLDNTALHGEAATFMGDDASGVSLGVMRIPQEQFTVSAWVQTKAVGAQNFIVSAMSDPYHPRKYPFQRGLALALVNGKLCATLNKTIVTAPDTLPLNQWVHVAVTYDGQAMSVIADGKTLASTKDFPTAEDVMGWNQETIHFGDPKLPFHGCGPQGLLAQHVTGVTTNESQKSLSFTIPKGGKATILVSAMTDRNTLDYENTVKLAVTQSDDASIAKLQLEHLAWWRDFWSKSYVTLPDKKVQDAWYGSLYLLACCSKPGSPPPGLWGNFITGLKTGWQGDYTLNYNVEAPFWAAYATNHLNLADNYEDPLLDYLPRGQAIAKHNGFSGLYYYTHLIPAPGWDDDPSTFLGQKSGILFGVVNCVMRWRYTHDLQYAKRVYPLLKGVAEFWDNSLVLQNGRYVDVNDGAVEGAGNNDTNVATTLAFLRLLYPTVIELSQKLNIDADRQSKWKDILAKLSPLPIVLAATVDHIRKTPAEKTLLDVLGPDLVKDKMVIRNTEIGTGFPIPMVLMTDTKIKSSSPGMNSLQVVFPGWQIGLESSELERKAALNTATFAAQWFDFNNNCTFYPSAAAIGYDPKSILDHLDLMIRDHSFSSFAFTTGGGGTENFAIVPATLAQMFLQSYQQNIHLFPNWPADQDASFGNLNACSGFLISSQISKNRVVYVQIQSTAGQECHVANPWLGSKVQAVPSGGKSSMMQGDILVFPTKVGQTITLRPMS